MAGRGRGGKTSSTLTQEQLQALGCVGKDMPSVTLAPPSIFPTLASKPIPLESNPDRDYKILWKEDFISFLKESAYYTNPKNAESKIQRYSDKYVNVLENDRKTKIKGEYLWDRMPAELKPNSKRQREIKLELNAAKKKSKSVNVVEQLTVLEQKEIKDRGLGDEVKDKDKDSDEENENVDEVEDEEMDDENDYDNNYFDNGEAFNEEDDNMDDGPIY